MAARDDAISFAELLRGLRHAAGLTQEGLAATASLSSRCISDLERGINQTARKDTARLLADALGLEGRERDQFEEIARGRPGSGNDRAPDPMLPRTAGSPLVVGAIPQRPAAARSRADLLAVVTRQGNGVPVVSALTGARGVGKTQLAAEAARARVKDRWCLVAWVNAGNRRLVLAGLQQVARELGLTGRAADAIQAAVAVRQYLEADGDQCLVVFDDVHEAEELAPYLPAAGLAQILITSNRRAMGNLGRAVPVDVFTPEEATAYLEERTGLGDLGGALQVAEEVGYLPLALAQAAAVINGQRLSYGTYVQRLSAVPAADYLPSAPGDPYPRGTAQAIALSVDTITDRRGQCRALLDLIAMLSATGVARSCLHRAGALGLLGAAGPFRRAAALSPAEVDALLGKLADSSLITISLTSGVVTAHRLVMRVIREQLAGGRRLHRAARAAATLLQDLLVPNERAWERPGEVEDLVKHVTALHEHLPSQTWTTVPDRRLAEAELSLRAHVMWYLNDMMTLPDHAVAFGHSLAADCEQVLGASHPLTLHAQHHLAYAYETAGHLPEAIRRYERTADERIRVLGPEDPATFWVRRHLAYAYLTAGRVSDAAALCEQLAGEAERLWGPGHPATLSARHTLAAIYTSAGRCSEAIQIGENVLAARRKVLGPDHNDTFTTRNMLSRAYETAGDYERALTLYTRNLADRERVLGHNHADTLASRFNLARACRAAGRHDEADQHEQALAGCDAALGPDHPYARAVRQGIAVVLRDPDLTKNPEFNIRRRTRPLLMLATTARSAADRQPAGGGWWLHTSLPKVAETHPVLERHDLAGSSDKAAGVIRNLPVSTPPSASGWRPAACWRSRTSSRTALPSTSRP